MKSRITVIIIICAVSVLTIFYSCNKQGETMSNATGKGGSLTRFTIAGDYLYAVDNHFLYAYSLSNPAKPKSVYTSPLNYDIETIYAYNNNLFLGTRTGLYVYSIAIPDKPEMVGEARHARSCDPVVANDSVAFVTLKSSAGCGPAVSGLYIHDIKNIKQPVLKKMIALPDPVGLGLQDSILYVCCGKDGLKVFNVKDPYTPLLLSTKTDATFIDVIPYNGILICMINEGIMLYDITNPATPGLLKKIAD